jgi:hypothetical protein
LPEPETVEAVPPYEPIKAVVRIRIAKKQPEPVEDEEGNVIEQEINEDDLEEMPIEDKCLSVAANKEDQSIFVINQAAQRILRKEIITEISQSIEALRSVDLEDFMAKCEKDAEEFERNFCAMFSDESTSNAPKVPVFDYAPTL